MDLTTILATAAKISAEAIQNYGPIAWETTLWLVRIDRIEMLCKGFLALAILIIFQKYCYIKLWEWAEKKARSSDGTSYIPALVLTAGIYIFSPIGVLLSLFNIWNWVGLFWPELYLAKIALDKVL